MKNKRNLIVPVILLFCSCKDSRKEQPVTSEKADSNLTIQTAALPIQQQKFYTSDLRPGQQLPLKKIFTDTVSYTDFSGDGDYTIFYIKTGNRHFSLIADNIPEEKLNFLRGDTLEIKWMMDSLWVAGDGETLHFTEWLTGVRKISDGRIEAFRKKYTKPLKYWYAKDETYSKEFKDYLYKLVEYYIAYSEKDLVKLHLKNPDQTNFVYSVEDGEKNDRAYTILGLSNDMGDHSSIIQWLYLDSESRLLYEYDPATDKLIEFP